MGLKKYFALAILLAGCLAKSALAQESGKITRPVDSEKSFERSTLQAEEYRVWTLLIKLLTNRGFGFVIKDKDLGRIETTYIVFSRSPEFSKLNNGVKSLARTPRLFLRKWVDGRMKIYAEVRRLSQNSTEVVLKPDIYGFVSTLTDDTGVTGEWRQCTSNGKFEFELFNEMATELRKEGSMNPVEVTQVAPKVEGVPAPPVRDSAPVRQRFTNLMLSSVPDGAEILLDNLLVGMTPSRLTITAGEHKIIFCKRGFKNFERQFIALEDSDLTISAEMDKAE